jgi:hypothetical protein
MSCFVNGQPIVPTAVKPQRFRVSSTGAGAISISFPITCEVVMEQMTVHLNTAATTSAKINLKRDAVDLPAYDTLYRSEDLAAINATDFLCIVPFRWSKGDVLLCDYANPDARTVGVVIWLVQVDA